MKGNYKLHIGNWLLLSLLPALWNVLFSSSSLADGLAVALILFAIFHCLSTTQYIRYTRAYLLLLLFIGLHFLVVFATRESPVNFLRFYLSFCFLLLFGLVAIMLKKSFEENIGHFFPIVANNTTLILFINSLLGLFAIDLFSAGGYKPVGFFSEPSIFAITLAPFLAYQIVSKTKWWKFYWVYFFIWSLVIQSLVTFLVCILTLMLIVGKRSMIFLFILIAIVFTQYDYFTSRLVLSSSNDNLSSLVFLQGWDMAFNYLNQTNGLGVGFNQFGIDYHGGDVQEKIFQLFSFERINQLDGGSNGAKIVGEFGLIGLFSLGVIVYKISYAFRELRQKALSSLNIRPDIFFVCVIYTSFIEFFVRGVGYFTPTFFMLFVALFFYKSRYLYRK